MAAANGKEPEGLGPPEALLYCRMREIYRAFRNGEITRELGADLKTAALAEYRQASVRWAQGIQAQHRMAWLFQAIEQYCSAYRKEHDLATADALMEAIYHVKRKEVKA